MKKTFFNKIAEESKISEDFLKNVMDSFSFDLYLSRILTSKFDNLNEIEKYLDSTLKKNLINPLKLLDFEKGLDIIYNTILQNKRILLFGDYDVDGVCSCSVFIRFFKMINFTNYEYFIPNRFKNGYGLTYSSLNELSHLDNTDLLITLDCGTSSTEEIKFLKQKYLNLNIIIIDHHKSKEILPITDAIINPNRFDETCEEDFKTLSAAGVLFLLIIFLARKFSLKEDRIFSLLQIVAISTVCDVMPLLGMNRVFVLKGLEIFNKNNNPEDSLFWIKEAFLKNNFTSYDFGFLLGPMINAGGRIDFANYGVEMLITNDKKHFTEMFYKLKNLNNERKEIESDIIGQINLDEDLIKKQIEEFGFIFIYNKCWHEGIIGIIASRLKEKYNRVTIVGFLNESNLVKCSIRSILDIDISKSILNLQKESLIKNGGGHKMAGGITFEEKSFHSIVNLLKKDIKLISDQSQDNLRLNYSSEISLNFVTLNFIKNINLKLEPYGNKNERPIFLIRNVSISYYKILKEKHLKLIITDGFLDREVMCFNAIENGMFNALTKNLSSKIDIFVTLNINLFQDKEYISITMIDCLIY